MGSSKNSGKGEKRYHGTIACVVAFGALYALHKILLNAEVVWTGPIYRSTSSNPVNLSTKYGTITFFWGTEDQPASTALNAFAEHPSYPGVAYAVFDAFDFGSSTNAYNAEFIVSDGPDQSIVTSTPAAESLDLGRTCNPIALAAEVLTSDAFLGRPASEIDSASFQAAANAVQAERPAGAPWERSKGAMSPLWDAQQDARKVMASIAGMANGWLRVSTQGKIECGLWRLPASAATIHWDDLCDWPNVDVADLSRVPTRFVIKFTDSEALHKEAEIPADDVGMIAEHGLRVNNIDARFLVTYEQALRAGEEALRLSSARSTWAGEIRYGKAKNAGGSRLQPGDYLYVPVSAPSVSPVETKLLRVEKVVWPKDSTGGVKVSGTIEPPSPGVLKAATVDEVAVIPDKVIPPINLMRVFARPPVALDTQPFIHVLACRPSDTALGFDVYYDDTDTGDFPIVAKYSGFALPMKLDASIDADDTLLTVSLLPQGANGEVYDRDDNFLRSWVGTETEGRNDELLAVIVQPGTPGAFEVCSIAGAPTLVDTDTFTIPILRGRLGTLAKAFTAAAFATLEVWIIPGSSLANVEHADIATAAQGTSVPMHFRAGAYARTPYDPAIAYEEHQRRVDDEEDQQEFAMQTTADFKPQVVYTLPVVNDYAWYLDSGKMPEAPSAITLSSSGVDIAPDGTSKPYIVLSVPAIKEDATRQTVVYRLHGTTNAYAVVADLSNQSPATVRIDGLTVGMAYDVGSYAYNTLNIQSLLTPATSSPFVAPGDTTAPAAPTLVTFLTTDYGNPPPVRYVANDPQLAWPLKAIWVRTPTPADADVAGVEYYVALPTATPLDSRAVDYDMVCLIDEPRFALYSEPQYNKNVWARFIDYTGNKSTWFDCGQPSWTLAYTGNMGAQNSNDVRLAGSTVASASASSPRRSLCHFHATETFYTVIGENSLTINWDISNRGFSTRPDVLSINLADKPAGAMLLTYWGFDASTSTNLVIQVYTADGSDWTAAEPFRLAITATEYD